MAIFKIPDSAGQYDDEKLNALINGTIQPENFIQLIAMDDPYVVTQGELKILTEEEVEKGKTNYVTQVKNGMLKTGGLTGQNVYDNQEAFKAMFPEIAAELTTADEQIKKENCQSCALNSKMQLVMQKLFGLDLKKPRVHTDALKGRIPDNAWRILCGEELKESDLAPIDIPPYFNKRKLKPKDPLASSVSILGVKVAKNILVKSHLAEAAAHARTYMLHADSDAAWKVVGHLQAAAAEAAADMPDTAKAIRELLNTILR